jgi:hypothetical protein
MALSATPTYPLSYPQESLWAPSGLSAINVPAVVRFRGRLDIALLLGALDGVVERHDALRTVLGRSPDGSLEQRVAPTGSLAIDIAEQSGSLERSLAGLLLAGSERPFRIDGGPLARAELHSFGADDHVVMVWMHHAISDLASSSVLADEIRQLYAGARLAPVGFQMSDVAVRERAARADPEQQRYWAAALRSADDRLGLPVSAGDEHLAVRPALPRLSGDVVESLGMLAASRRTTLAAVLASAAIAMHARDAAGGRVAVGLTVSNRDLPQLRSTLGCVADQLPLVVDIEGAPTFGELLGRVREALLDAYDHRLPLGVLLPWLRRQKPPLFAVNVNFLPPPRSSPGPAEAGQLRASAPELPYGIVKTRPDPWWLGDALLAYRPRVDQRGLAGEIEGDGAVHDAATVARYGRQFCALLARVARNPELTW